MQPVIWDTSIYISKFRAGLSWDLSFDNRMILSSVVTSELLTGFVNMQRELLEFDRFVKLMEEKNRIITPRHNDWYIAGITIGKIISKRPDLKNKKALLFNDCLIAISSRQINAQVITGNINDFELIRRYVNFNVRYSVC